MFLEYLKLGTGHILDTNGLDHILFLVVLVIIYDKRSWKAVLLLATAFTLGHSLTLAIASMDLVSVDSRLVELLIAVSIGLTALENIIRQFENKITPGKFLTALVFGLIHGLGFSGFFRTILGKDDIIWPLLAFNIGVEIAQVICVICVLILSAILTEIVSIKKRHLVIGTSLVILFYTIKLILSRL
jgi:hypothetical protein